MSASQSIDKRAVAAAFSKAAQHYDCAAGLQREVGTRLMAKGASHPGKQVLDAGCGTGYFSLRWREQGRQVTALDLSAGMLMQARQRNSASRYLLGDIERIALADASVDICFSNLAVQWCGDLSRAIDELYRVTRPGGMILFSTLLAGTLGELADAWSRVDGYPHVNAFLTQQQVLAACRQRNLQYETQRRTLFFPQVTALMRSLQGIGATHLHQGRSAALTGKGRFSALQKVYPVRSQGYPLSYQLFYGVITRE